MGSNSTLLFNLIKANKFATEQLLLKKSMLGLVELRTGLNLLMQQGFISCLPEGRTLLYYSLDKQELTKKYLEEMCKVELNLLLAAKVSLPKEKLLLFQN